MALELIFNLFLMVFCIVCFVNVGTTMPQSAANELGAEQWPQIILVLMMLAFLIAYGLLLGQRNIPLLLLTSVIITIILYVGFSVMLGVMLPRGQILPLRNFALFVESLVPRF